MQNLFISCPYGFEPILQKELSHLGLGKVFPSFCGVFASKTIENMFRANYLSRVATRVLWPLTSFRCQGKEDLYKHSREIAWDRILDCRKTFAIDANVQHPTLTNTLFASLVVKDSICDFFRDSTGNRPSVDTKQPDVQINLFIQKGIATIYLDTSGLPLHKRGWRDTNTEATLHESIAAALLLYSGYSPEHHIFCDPFAGSGTFLVEAGLIATRTPPGFFRKKWGFFHLPECDKKQWITWKTKQDEQRIPLPKGRIFGSDKSRETADVCLNHLRKSHLETIEMRFDEIGYYHPKVAPNFLLSNPPYGKRLETSPAVWEGIKTFVQTKMAPEKQAFILYPECIDLSPLTVKETFSFKNGGLPVKLLALS